MLLISLGIVSNNHNDEGNNLVAQTDTTIVSPQTGAKEIETRPQEKKVTKEMADTVKRVKEIIQMSKPPRHYMARQETKAESHAEPEVTDAADLAEQAIAEEERRFAMEMMSQMNGSLQPDYQEMTREIRQRGERMNRQVEMAVNDDKY
jgi:gamma-glutamylcysteine synthetase